MTTTPMAENIVQLRQLPWSNPSEQSVLGSVLIKPEVLPLIRPLVDVADFFHPAHAAIFDAMLALGEASLPVDFVSVSERMRQHDSLHRLRALDGAAYFAVLTDAVASVENVAYHARLVRSYASVRRLVEETQAIAAQGLANFGEADEYLAAAEARVARIVRGSRMGQLGYRPIGDVLGDVVNDIRRNLERVAGEPPLVIPTGFDALDQCILGWEAGTMAVLAARPGLGKTALMCDFVEAAAGWGVPCFVGTREMTDRALVRRRLAAASGIEHSKLRAATGFNQQEWLDMTVGASRLSELPIMISQPFVTLEDFEALVRLWRAKETADGQLAMVTLDYLQLCGLAHRGHHVNREQEVAEMSRRLKSLAQDLGLALLVVAQLNRGSERENRRPRMSDLRDSGQIEQDADVVAFLHRAMKDTDGLLIIAKQRNGPLGDVAMRFDPEHVRYINETGGVTPAPPTDEEGDPT